MTLVGSGLRLGVYEVIVDNTFSVVALLHSTRYPGSTHDGRRANTVLGYYGIEGR
jgi:hypothetical protein